MPVSTARTPCQSQQTPLKCLKEVDADDGKEKTQKDEGGLEREGGEGDGDEEDEGEGEEDEAGPQLQLSPSGQYFIQTPDGQIIQVLGSLDDESIQAEPILGESQASEADEGRARSENIVAVGETERNMQIFVVGGNSGEEVYLINAPEREIGDSDQGSALPVSAMMLKDVEASSAQADLTTGKLPADLEAKAGEAENLLTVSLQGENQSLKNSFLDTLPKVPLEKDSLDIQISTPQIQGQVSKPRTALPFAKSLSLSKVLSTDKQTLETKTKPRLPIKMQSPLELLTEGMRVQTDRGEMMAFNLSSVTQAKQMGLHGQKSLKNIASLFGSVVKVLRPVAEEKKQEVLEIKDRPILLSCNECGALLHSERSLQIHIRRYHEEWQDECSLCGEKFYSASYVRSHIQKVHSQDASFQCRLCSYESNELKAIIKHQKVHGKCQSCEKCGKKYKTPKVFRAHVMNCKGSLKMESRVPSKRKGTQVSTSSDDSSQRDGDTDVGVHEVSGEPQAKHQKIEVNVTENREVSSLETYSPTKTVQTKRRYGKVCQAEEGVKKKDAEFKPTSKHYHQQILKMTVEQRPTRHSARGRDRTHRCYLCFKLFSTANELDAHKESYHQVKSARPVRVRTDASLEEEEEDFASTTSVNIKSSHTQSHEDVVIKEEPLEFAEEYENVTIILDDVMKSTHVVKPLCIACKAVTNTDYRKSSKWFSKVPDDDHSEALKRFEQFFPCAIDPKKLMVPWVICKKCVLLIDKIADMEEKLNSMKSDLMLRFRGSDKDTSDNLNDLPQSDLSENVSSLSADNTGLPGQGDLAEGIGKSLADIEAYMKDTCEIMEITKLRKRPGRPRRQQAEKLTPVIVSGDEEEEPTSMNEVVKIVAKGLKKETKASSVEVTCKNWNDRKGSTEVSQKNAEENCLPRVKEEPIHDGFEDIIPGPDSSSWDEIGSNSLACLTNLQEEDFLIGSTKVRKGGDSTSQLFTDQNSSIDSSATEASQDAEHLGQTSEKPLDNDATDQGSNKLKPEQRLEDMSLEKKPDMPLVFETGDSSESQCSKSRDKETEQNLRNFMGALEEAANDLVKKQSEDPQSTDMEKDAPNIEIGKLLKIPNNKVLGKKRAMIREERNRMSYRVDGATHKPWACSECHKGFSTQRGACDHYAASHSGQSYSCEYCRASYVRKRDLIGHYNKVHLNTKPYKCKHADCDEKFSCHSDLYRHFNSAHNSQNSQTSFTCQNCCATFAKKRYLDSHLLSCASKASDHMPYKCTVCDKAFKLCGEGFMRRSAIENHILDRHHGLEFMLSSNTARSNKEGGMATSATSPFISVVGAEDASTDDSYIVIYADEDEELENSQEMEVTVSAEGGENSAGLTSKQLPLGASCHAGSSVTVEQQPDVLSRVIMKGETSSDNAEAIIAFMSTEDEVVVPTITMQEDTASNIDQVMEIDPAQFSQEVVTCSGTVPEYT
ncbi:putative gastrula zinc finger protein XlCGF57.1-like [Penaeus vannamei]|uniref:Putative gastrula zinc finger protein XlCGF57.1-like n=2 Tax=Penaeus vannamei TaxID=6689 RepID=A0A3R7N8T4_PENVA|nr:putative gastrula zinc finger protein XlCGF57.1-like [Penaeus vannamei]